jgi:hypothetical protein
MAPKGGQMKRIAAELYVDSLTRLYQELKVPRLARELIGAFLKASNHQVEFEVSKMELAKHMFDNSEKRENLKSKVTYRLKQLSDWQQRNGVEFVRTIERGHRETNENETTVFVPSRYKFVLLAPLVNAFVKGNADKFAAAIEEAIETGKAGMEVAEPPKTYIRKQIQRDKNTFKRTLQRMFEQAAATTDIDPFDYCRNAILMAEEELDQLNRAWKLQQGRQSRLERHRAVVEKHSESKSEQTI